MRLTIMPLALVALLSGIGQAEVKVSQTTDGSHKIVNVGASVPFSTETSSGPTPTPKSHKPHYQPQRVTQDSPAVQKSVSQAGGSEPRKGVPDVKKESPGNIDVIKGNDAGKFNMGSPDHTPGTSGTSGQ